MIVEHHKKGWRIVSHYTHGLLAGKLAEKLNLDLRPNQWIDTLTAIIEHDDYLLDFGEQNYLTDIGTPLDYRMSAGTDKQSHEHAERVYRNAIQKSQFTGMLVGRHLIFLYSDLAEAYTPMKQFIERVKEKGKVQRRIYGLNKTEEKAIYDLMRFCDRCSLILCQNQIPTVGRKLEINGTINHKTYYIFHNEAKTITVEPWPFEKAKFTLNYEYRVLLESVFKNNSELEMALKNADVRLEELTFEK